MDGDIDQRLTLEHFQAKWTPVRAKKMRQNNNLEHLAEPTGSENALGAEAVAVKILLGHTKIENTVHYLSVDVEDAPTLAESTE